LASVRVLEAEIGRDHNQTLSARNNLAGAYYLTGRLDKAAAIIARSVRREPGSVAAVQARIPNT
jgi:Flp pilus assembly protein TadD